MPGASINSLSSVIGGHINIFSPWSPALAEFQDQIIKAGGPGKCGLVVIFNICLPSFTFLHGSAFNARTGRSHPPRNYPIALSLHKGCVIRIGSEDTHNMPLLTVFVFDFFSCTGHFVSAVPQWSFCPMEITDIKDAVIADSRYLPTVIWHLYEGQFLP